MNRHSRPIAVVTGGARRIGAAISRALHQDGYDVVIHFGNSQHESNQLAADLNALRPNSAWTFQADLTDNNSLSGLSGFIQQQFNRCDLLINNASSFFPTPLGECTESDWDTLFSSNAKAPLFLIQQLRPLFQQSSSIVNLADIHAERPLKNHTIYCMAKAANVMLTKSLALELAPDIRVNGIAPGAILPPATGGGVGDTKKFEERVPLRKMGGENAIVETVKYLVHADYVTGEIIAVDGGRSLLQ
ncbi:pteridine reductase [Teredinibacter turnerae]|uniref:pteridine reductase n=1 Tax=Teredinibacter turnerae TaxID=2426 RepID=UPI0005F87264|nr:pteridine reductase [Teredinibacter turnerae]